MDASYVPGVVSRGGAVRREIAVDAAGFTVLTHGQVPPDDGLSLDRAPRRRPAEEFMTSASPAWRLMTFGHGTASSERIAALLGEAGVRAVVDVRRFPASRLHPHVAREALEDWLPRHGLSYRWEPRLGGRRHLPAGTPSPDTWWTVAAFRAYATYTRTEDFAAGLDALADEASADPGPPVTVMCSESLWWRCHRRLIADVVVLTRGAEVLHLAHDGRLHPHRPSAGARVVDGAVVWDRPAETAG